METAQEIAEKPARELPACPVETTLMLISDKWKVLILRDLMPGTKRFSELKRSVGHVTQKVLTAQLRQMEESGLLTRTVYPEVPPRVEYALSGLGQSLRPIIEAMAEWGQNYKDRFQVRKTDRNALLRSPGGPQVLIHRRHRGPVARAYVCSDLRAAWCFRARNIPAKERVAQ